MTLGPRVNASLNSALVSSFPILICAYSLFFLVAGQIHHSKPLHLSCEAALPVEHRLRAHFPPHWPLLTRSECLPCAHPRCEAGSLRLALQHADMNGAAADNFYIEGASASIPLSIAKVTLNEIKTEVTNFSIVWSSSPDVVQYKPFLSTPEFIEFPTSTPAQKAYAYFYPPSNPNFHGLPDEKPPLLVKTHDEKPPLLVKTHGGPTAEMRAILDLSVQYWLSRGWAYVDVNYGGSTGYGREYRERLQENWSVVDVDDCCSCSKFLVENGKVNGERLCITGRLAGGYTTLASLAFRGTFKAGASLHGIGELTSMRAETQI